MLRWRELEVCFPSSRDAKRSETTPCVGGGSAAGEHKIVSKYRRQDLLTRLAALTIHRQGIDRMFHTRHIVIQ